MDTRENASEEGPDRASDRDTETDAATAPAEAGVDWEALGRAVVRRYRRVLADLGE